MLALDKEWRELQTAAEQSQATRNRLSREVGAAKKRGESVEDLLHRISIRRDSEATTFEKAAELRRHWPSHNTGFDMSSMSTLPPRFSVRELNEPIIAANASPVGFVGLLIEQYGQDGEITWDEFMRYGLHAATGYASTQAGTAGQIADYLEEIFEATGSRGGFMLGHSQCGPRDQLQSIVDLLIPELRRRGRFRTAYTGRTLR